MITVSENAQNYFRSLLSKEPPGTQIRVFIINPGTPSAECGVAYCLKSEVEESDIQLKYNQFFIYIDKNIIAYLKNSEIDLVYDKLGSQLTFKAPYAKCNILNKNSYLLEDRVKYFLNMEINPQLSMHGGKVNLIKINQKNGTAIIQFSGGCNGCSMIGMTLKETVEKKLLASFPEIKKVYDGTEHLHGQHSFY
ncbi:MAG: NfuA family Fe-S biogenesis protein [Buchnera aphidicola (Brevicoryne brassicae)]|uniref:Fe/S biogenesis protein NfuA n=1 Tax=Buchnera aphidicola (Brevicoryne brassicae) TaxID=911343 RepID=A0AAJ5PUA7_9GAMM|nr:NfuA family Fe-S biogenesis protein [Buchnera aphidicola]QCI20084.1 NfuA family Fe-S biogenesis protein [Buchnera aphidicola (Brevicoryne brassicae)]WAI18909.1 MAG: NfuA family Fe-S biogenesis protein [Buchnera aphidicola (Brevicoryne brassicae)]